MGKKAVKIFFLIIVIFVIFGIICGLKITLKRENNEKNALLRVEKIFSSLQAKEVEVTKFCTYGDSLNVSRKAYQCI